MSPRDLPVWARGTTAGLLLLAAWLVPRYESLLNLAGPSSPEIAAGLVALSVLLGMRLPVQLWPGQPERRGFSMVAALAVPLLLGGLVLLSGGTGLPEMVVDADRGLFLAIVGGGAVWALALGRVSQTAYLRWFGLAAGVALIPLLTVVTTLVISHGEIPSVPAGTFVRVAAFFLVAGTTGALVTQELAFRRVLIGQSGDAGLATILLAGLIFGLWHGLLADPMESLVYSVVQGTLNGVVLGCLYALTRSLLVPAVYHGVSMATMRAFELTADISGAQVVLTDTAIYVATTTAIVALILAHQVRSRSGFLGILSRGDVIHAPGD